MKIKILNIAIMLITLVGTLILLSALPDLVPVHFNGAGVADRWGSKYELLIMSGIMVVMLAIWFITDATHGKKMLESPDEKKRAEAINNIKVMNITFTVISVMFMLLNFATIYMSYSQLEDGTAVEIDIFKIVCAIMGISFVIMGNIMPKTKNNPFLGFRFPWTRYNDVTWQKCNRMGGIVMVISGILITLESLIFAGTVSMIIMMITLGIALVFLLIYAYLVYHDEVKKNES